MLFQLGRSDPYALVLFEGHAGRTSTIWNNHNPRWASDAPRAFCFPITCPFANIYIAVSDDDRGVDDPLGRVVLPLFR